MEIDLICIYIKIFLGKDVVWWVYVQGRAEAAPRSAYNLQESISLFAILLTSPIFASA